MIRLLVVLLIFGILAARVGNAAGILVLAAVILIGVAASIFVSRRGENPPEDEMQDQRTNNFQDGLPRG